MSKIYTKLITAAQKQLANDIYDNVCGYLCNNLQLNNSDINIIISEIRNIFEHHSFTPEERKHYENIEYRSLQLLLSKFNEKSEKRKSNGVYYTPSDVTEFIISNVAHLAAKKNKRKIEFHKTPRGIALEYLKDCSIFDPTCGAGEFLIQATKLKLSAFHNLNNLKLTSVLTSIYGNDIDPISTIITKVRIILCCLEYIESPHLVGISKILNRNFSEHDFVNISIKDWGRYDVIIGNPPYVESSKSDIQPKTNYGNIFANVLENSSKLLTNGGVMGFVLPISIISTQRMSPIRNKIVSEMDEVYFLNYSDRPDCLFSGVHQKLTILLCKNISSTKGVYTSGYSYWYKSEREWLFDDVDVIKHKTIDDLVIPKFGTESDMVIFNKLSKFNEKITDRFNKRGEYPVSLNMRLTFWVKCFTGLQIEGDYSVYYTNSAEISNFIFCILNSSIFWWYWVMISDCWHITGKELNNFGIPYNFDKMKVNKLAVGLQKKLEDTKKFVGTKQINYEYKHKLAINEIHKIDDYVASLYGLTKEESSYIKEFSIKYRVGDNNG
jgi:hypothetical protein